MQLSWQTKCNLKTALKPLCVLITAGALINPAYGYDVMMIVGGMSTLGGFSSYHRSVEVVDTDGVCMAPALPHALFGAGGGTMQNLAVVCGGNDSGRKERYDCWSYHPQLREWSFLTNLPHGRTLIFPATTTDDDKRNLFLAGGRSFNYTTRRWDYLTDVWKLEVATLRWTRLPSLADPVAESCLLYLGGDLVLIGGSKAKFRYADDPSKVWVLPANGSEWSDDLLPKLRGPRTWQGCLLTHIEGQAGILTAGGYYNGRLSLYYKLGETYDDPNGDDRWQTAGWLPAQRQWGPSLGLVSGVPTIAAGMDYGDTTIDEFHGWEDWTRVEDRVLRYKREFGTALTVPNHWFPDCNTNPNYPNPNGTLIT